MPLHRRPPQPLHTPMQHTQPAAPAPSPPKIKQPPPNKTQQAPHPVKAVREGHLCEAGRRQVEVLKGLGPEAALERDVVDAQRRLGGRELAARLVLVLVGGNRRGGGVRVRGWVRGGVGGGAWGQRRACPHAKGGCVCVLLGRGDRKRGTIVSDSGAARFTGRRAQRSTDEHAWHHAAGGAPCLQPSPRAPAPTLSSSGTSALCQSLATKTASSPGPKGSARAAAIAARQKSAKRLWLSR